VHGGLQKIETGVSRYCKPGSTAEWGRSFQLEMRVGGVPEDLSSLWAKKHGFSQV